MSKQMFMATVSGAAEIDGESIVFVKDKTIVASGHPLLSQVPDYFTPVEQHQHYETTEEQQDAPKKSKKDG